MELHSIVVLTLNSPKEKVWGEVIAITPAGITILGVDVNAFDETLRQVAVGEAGVGALATVFFPMHRIERVSLDEAVGDIPSLAERFEKRVGLSLLEFLHAGHEL